MAQFASGKFAWGLCDYCGFRFHLNSLKPTMVQGRPTGFLACTDDWSEDHPQNFLPQAVASHGDDAEALRNPRPEPNSDRTIHGNPNWLSLAQKGNAGV